MQGSIHPHVGLPHFAPIGHPHRVDHFERLAAWAVRVTGGRWGFRVAAMMFLAWGMSGPYFDYCEVWRMTFFIGTSSVTFLTVFLARNAQIRSSKAVHLKLDELIYALKKADNELIESEDLTERELDQMRERHRRPTSRCPCRRAV
jgi:low affinity Fe/Cu permease